VNILVKNAPFFILAAFALACTSYKQNIMFRTPEGFQSQPITEAEKNIAPNYRIEKSDLITVDIFSNNGELIIDPNPALTNSSNNLAGEKEKLKYLVTSDGTVRLPLVGEVNLEGLTLREAEISIQSEFSKYYKDPYVLMEFLSKRVTLLGATGGKVIPLQNQNTRLTEVLALGEGLDNDAKAHNIRVLRGQEVFIVDLSTIEGYQSGNMLIQPGDIIYVEPVRRPFSEAVRENGSIISIIVSLASLVVIILNVR